MFIGHTLMGNSDGLIVECDNIRRTSFIPLAELGGAINGNEAVGNHLFGHAASINPTENLEKSAQFDEFVVDEVGFHAFVLVWVRISSICGKRIRHVKSRTERSFVVR